MLIVKDLGVLTKHRLSMSVVFSSLAGYLLGAESLDIKTLLLLSIGGYCMVGASNVYNQVIERRSDSLMKRTANRPVATGRMSVQTALIIGFLMTLLGLFLLFIINPITALFGAISIFLYTSIYTPLKQVTPLSVFIGAFPGAIPFMLGWVAATGDFSIEPGTLFMIQFFWQFPHFWALGWWLYDDYEKGGFFMLPTGKRDASTALQIVLYSIWTVLISVIPALGLTGRLLLSPAAAVIVFLFGITLIYFAVRLYRIRTKKAAKELMLASVSYITLIQIVYVVDKTFRVWI
jgi:protoheme IX farnesyltransferase